MTRNKRAPSARATIQDVAKHAGVSKSTVSKYFNTNEGYYVSLHARERILNAIAELDYQPNYIARGLAQNKTMTIGLVAADIQNPFYPDLVAGVQSVIEPQGYTVVLGSTGSDPAREQDILRSMFQKQVDGVILGSARLQVDALKEFLEAGMKIVLASRNLPKLVADTVVVDNFTGAHIAVDHLVELGHKRIAHIAGPQDVVPFQQRLAGYKDALSKHHLSPDTSNIIEALSTPEAGAAAAQQILSNATLPTAIFVANDNMALGVLDTTRRMGFRIPEEVAIVGFDNISLASNSFISLTTVDSDAETIGGLAAKLLIDRLKNNDTAGAYEPKNMVHPPKLHIRGTT